MSIINIHASDDALTVHWSAGDTDTYHYVWLRDNLLGESNLDLTTGERMRNFHEIPARPTPESVTIDAGDVVIVWQDTHEPCRYPARWLRENAYSDVARRRRQDVFPASQAWTFRNWDEGPCFDFKRIEGDAASELECLRAFKTFGVVYLRNTPATTGVAVSLCERLGYVREVAFGRVREIRSDPAKHQNVGFSSDEINPHADAANYLTPYQVQFLHCVVNDARGGDSRIVDARTLAERFRVEQPEHFDTLSRVPVSYRINYAAHDLRADAPVIELDKRGRIVMIRFSNQQRRALSVAHEDVVPFFDAYRAFSELVNARANQFHFRFTPGDVLMFDNYRLLHGRTSFEPASGPRHLQLASTDMDMVDSRIRVLMKEVDEQLDTGALLPEELSGLKAATAPS